MNSDFNGDGRDDVLWRHNDFDYSYTNWLAKPDGGFVISGGLPWTYVPNDWQVLSLGDYNGDGRADILWRHSSGLVTNWLGTPGNFVNNHLNSATARSTDWNVAGSGDFNGDGRADILWRHDDGMVSDWLGIASGGFIDNQLASAATVPTDWTIAGTGDFNGDGRDDILWRHNGGMVTDWLGEATGGFVNNHANSATTVPKDWIIVGTGDFNGDGRDDVLWRHQFGAIETWLGRADGGFANNHANSMPGFNSDWSVLQTGDFNGDGRDDILWGDFRTPADIIITNWLGTAAGAFISNDHAALIEIDFDWLHQPSQGGAGFWDY